MTAITGTGYLKAVVRYIQPLLQVTMGLTLFLLLINSRKLDHLSLGGKWSPTLKNLVYKGAMEVFYCLIIIFLAADILHLLFRDEIAPATEVLPLMKFNSIVIVVDLPAGVILASVKRWNAACRQTASDYPGHHPPHSADRVGVWVLQWG